MAASRLPLYLSLGFGVFALVFSALGGWFLYDATRFQGALHTEGVVDRLEWHTTRNQDNTTSQTATTVVHFQDGDRTVEIRSRIQSMHPPYAVGQKVPVHYLPGEPDQGRIETFTEDYLLPLVFLIVGGITALVAVGLLVIPAALRRRRALILLNGTPVEAKVVEVRRDTSVTVNEQSPWVLTAEYYDKGMMETYRFVSHYLWTDPLPFYPVGGPITVYYCPDKPTTYIFPMERLTPPANPADPS